MSDGDRIVFASTLPQHMRAEVEALFFFNPRQALLREGIHAAVAAAGLPAISVNDESVWIEVAPGTTQCLFACDCRMDPFRVVGVILYSRPAADTIWISHLAIDPAYAYGGEHGALGIATRLVDRVMTIARSVKGVARVQLPYRDGSYIRVWRDWSGRGEDAAAPGDPCAPISP